MSAQIWMLVCFVMPAGVGSVLYFLLRQPIVSGCPACGTRIQSDYHFCPQCACQVSAACGNCYRSARPTDLFCVHCGHDLAADSMPAARPPTSPEPPGSGALPARRVGCSDVVPEQTILYSCWSMTLKALIVDDEKLAREELEYLLGSIDDVEVVAQGKNGIEAIALVPRLEPDVVFLDVQMPGLDGFAVFRKLLEKTGPETLPQIIFATAFDKYAVRAFEVNAVDYLLKPFDRARLEQAMDRVRARLQNPARQNSTQSPTQAGHETAPSSPRTPALSREQVDSLIRLIEQQSGGAPSQRPTAAARSSSRPARECCWWTRRSYASRRSMKA